MDAEFLKTVQRMGWMIVAVDEKGVTGGCPRASCGLTTYIAEGTEVPQACAPAPALAEVVVNQFEHIRLMLRYRRLQLGLTIKEMEEAAGIAADHAAKFEKDDPFRIPNTQTFIEWANGLGYDVVLRPGTLPPVTLRLLSNTRGKTRGRFKVQGRFPGRRRGASVLQSPQGE